MPCLTCCVLSTPTRLSGARTTVVQNAVLRNTSAIPHLAQAPRTLAAPALLLRPRNLSCAAEQAASSDPYYVKTLSFDDVEFSFARSGGAGGQNVNKVATKCDMRIHIESCSWMSEEVLAAVQKKFKNKINNEGYLVVASSKHRTQLANKEEALEKLQKFLDSAGEAARPNVITAEKAKKLKVQKKKANERRLKNKDMQSKKKADRRKKPGKWD